MDSYYSADDVAKAKGLQFLAVRRFLIDMRRIYDYVCSLHEEWTFLRQSQWTKVKGLYIITRYIPFLVLITTMYLYFVPNETPDKCRMVMSACTCLGIISILCSELFFVLRTCALWNNNRIVLATMLSFVSPISLAALQARGRCSIGCGITISVVPTITGCYRISQGIQGSITFLLLFAFQLGLVSLTIIRAVQNRRVFNSPLYEVVVKHNLFYYTCGLRKPHTALLVKRMFLLILLRTLITMYSLQYFVLAILATRMHRNLWQIDRQARGSVTDTHVHISHMSFVDRTVTTA
ncbi:hypothetical protein P692DRAFT_20732041 [Suillus brevipes Sb2]|nr:hypothetical protein P692DRAFT_20732041 [Suillus brevipes Sb2]